MKTLRWPLSLDTDQGSSVPRSELETVVQRKQRVRRAYVGVLRRAWRVGWRRARDEYFLRERVASRAPEDVSDDLFVFELLHDGAWRSGRDPVAEQRSRDIWRASRSIAFLLASFFCAGLSAAGVGATLVVMSSVFMFELMTATLSSLGEHEPERR